MTPLDTWLTELAYTDFPDELFRSGEKVGTRPYAAEIEEMLAADRGIGASAVFCVGEQPTVCFIDASMLAQVRERRVEQIRQRVWNQNLASVVLVLDPEGLTAYAVNDRAAEPDVLARSDIRQRGLWSAYEVQAGFIRDRLSSWFLPQERVDQRLLANLREIVNELTRDGLSASQAEALMAQAIFLCYLEQRGIVGEAYRSLHKLEVLEAYVARNDGSGVDRLLKQLGTDFNGDFLSSSDGGAPPWSSLKRRSFRSILSFLEAVDVETGQGSFWRYDFSHIPVELISSIYETLLKGRQRSLGAYYTPRHLANLVTDQAFESVADPSVCTVFDGACGSGILLTTAFRKILRHAEVAAGRRQRLSERIALIKRTVFGSDIDETACWITAFSLYLSLLEGLEPADISLLQTDSNLKLPALVGSGLNIQKGTEHGDFFSTNNPFAGSGRFDIFLCNPPWRESAHDEEPTWEAWCREQSPPYPIGRRQIAAGFAYRAAQSVNAAGVVTLIMPLNLIIGASPQSCAFRQRLLEDTQVDRVINFGDLSRLLFPAAMHPCAVVRLRPRPRAVGEFSIANETIEYWTPKTDVSLALGRLALHAVDRKILYAHEIYLQSYLLISSYWGERRDIELLRRLQRFGTVGQTMQARVPAWLSGKGFHAPNQSNPDRELGRLGELAFLPIDRMPDSYPVIADDVQLGLVRESFSIVASPGGQNARLYIGPRVIFPDGLADDHHVRAVYSEVPFAFTSSIGAIGGPPKDSDLLKFLTAYLRSPLASYLLVMTGYSVIAERRRIAIVDLEAFPFCAPETHPNPKGAAKIVKEVAEVMDSIAAIPEWQRDHAYEIVREHLDRLIYAYFTLTPTDRILVVDTAKFIATSIQPPSYERLTTPLLHRPAKAEIEQYITVLIEELAKSRTRNHGEGALSVRAVVDTVNGFFGAIEVKTSQGRRDSSGVVTTATAFQKLLSDLQDGLEAQADVIGPDDLFKIPNLMVVVGDTFYLVKPLRRRFWLERTALTDADHIVRSVQAAAWQRAYS